MKISSFDDADYADCIADLVKCKTLWSMNDYTQHADVSCLEHSFYVSYISYLICKRLRLDFYSAARGGLLHDFFLYNWHGTGIKGLHSLKHSRIALQNANKYFKLNNIERDIIQKHMWPLTITPPKYKEAFIVMAVDKYCTCVEVLRYNTKSLLAHFDN